MVLWLQINPLSSPLHRCAWQYEVISVFPNTGLRAMTFSPNWTHLSIGQCSTVTFLLTHLHLLHKASISSLHACSPSQYIVLFPTTCSFFEAPVPEFHGRCFFLFFFRVSQLFFCHVVSILNQMLGFGLVPFLTHVQAILSVWLCPWWCFCCWFFLHSCWLDKQSGKFVWGICCGGPQVSSC